MKKIVALILSVIMIISLMPMVVFAAGNTAQELSFDENDGITAIYSLGEGEQRMYSFTVVRDGYYDVRVEGGAGFDIFLDGSEPDENFEGGVPYQTMGGGGGPGMVAKGYNFDAGTKYFMVIHPNGNITQSSGNITIVRNGDKIQIGPLPTTPEINLNEITSFTINSSYGETANNFAVFKGEETREYLQINAYKGFQQYLYPSFKIKDHEIVIEVESNKACLTAKMVENSGDLIIKADKNATAKSAIITVNVFLENNTTKEKTLAVSKDFNVNITPQEYINDFEFLESSKSAKKLYAYNDSVMLSIDIKAPSKVSIPSFYFLSEENEQMNENTSYYSVNYQGYKINSIDYNFQARTSGKFMLACLPLILEDGNKVCIVNSNIKDFLNSPLAYMTHGYKVIFQDLSAINFEVLPGIEDYNAPIINSIELVNADENGKINAQRARFKLDVKDPENSDMNVNVNISDGPNDMMSGIWRLTTGTAYKGKDGFWYCDIDCKNSGDYRVVNIDAYDIYNNRTTVSNSKGYDYESMTPEEMVRLGLTPRDLSNANFTAELDPEIISNNVISYVSINNKTPKVGERVYYAFHVEAPEGKEIANIQVEKYYGDSYWGDSAWLKDPKSFNADIPTDVTVGKNGLKNITVYFTDGTSIAYVDKDNPEYTPGAADTVIPIDMSNSFAYVEASSDTQGPIIYPETFYASGKIKEVGDELFFRLKVDDETGLSFLPLTANYKDENNSIGYFTVNYNAQTGYLEGNMINYGTGTFELISLTVSDVLGNTTVLYNSAYPENEGKEPATDLSQLCYSIKTFEDSVAPIIDSTSIKVENKNVAPNIWNNLSVNIADDSPLYAKRATIGVKAPHQEWPEYHEIYEKGEGEYSGLFNEMYCGNYQIMYITAKDVSGNCSTVIDNRYKEYIENLIEQGFYLEGEFSYADLSAGDYRVGMMDENTNVFVSGDNISDGAQIAVSEISKESDTYEILVGEDSNDEVKACFEVSVNGEYKSFDQPEEQLLISFQPEGVVAGDTVTIKHLRSSDGQIETSTAEVQPDGTVNMMVTEFSPFMVLVDASKRHVHKFHDGYCELCNEHSSVSHKGLYAGGDVNGDGEINNLDLVRTMKTIIGIDEESVVSRDFNDDGIINAADLVRMVRFMNKEEVIVY